MSWEMVLDVFLDALKDSALVFAFVFIIHFLLAFIEEKLAAFLVKKKKVAPLFGSLFGLIPQCGTSVLGADLYIKKYITIGTLVAIFLSCSDEAVIIMLTHWNEKTIMVLPLIASKFVIGFLIGVLVDLFFRKQETKEEYIEKHECHQHHHESSNLHKFLIHPLLHSLEIFLYVFIINMVLGMIIAWVGETNFTNFLVTNKYLTPLFSTIIGLIPNCASSILITELYMSNSLSFGALLGGLLVNSGLGMMILLKNKNTIKDVLIILSICFTVAVASGYICCLIFGF
ncbi:MAG: arsenic efflux protein [Bacilli bacterium]|nr:arsenic efflux protein [Bacilli bacterium]